MVHNFSGNVNELPGPKGLPFLGNLHQINKKKFHLQLAQWCTEHGSVYKLRIGRKAFVVIGDSEIIHGILRRRPDTFRRMSSIESVFEEMSNKGVFSVEGETWRKQRRLIMPAFQNRNLKEFFTTLVKITSRLKKRWDKFSAKENDLEICKDLMRFTVDVTTHLAFDYDINTLEKDGDVIQKSLEEVFPAIYRRINAPFAYWRYFKLPKDRALDRALLKIRTKFDEMSDNYKEQLTQNPELKAKPKNLLEALLNAQDNEGIRFTQDEVFGNVMTILAAGEDTTANVLAWAIYYMIENPEIQKKIRIEVKQIIGDADELNNFEDTEKLTYIEAVILEAMRLKSVAPIFFLETNTDYTINNLTIPKNTNVLAMTHYEPLQEVNFTNANEFIPERWIQTQRPEHWQHNVKAFIPFGDGPRVCPGKSLAMLEMKVVLSMICKNFYLTKPRNAKTPQYEFSFAAMAIDVWANIQPN